jgi:hypothetical protein
VLLVAVWLFGPWAVRGEISLTTLFLIPLDDRRFNSSDFLAEKLQESVVTGN